MSKQQSELLQNARSPTGLMDENMTSDIQDTQQTKRNISRNTEQTSADVAADLGRWAFLHLHAEDRTYLQGCEAGNEAP